MYIIKFNEFTLFFVANRLLKEKKETFGVIIYYSTSRQVVHYLYNA